jgi:hypothetical protein
MRSFRLDVGHGNRLTMAGRVLVALSVSITAALGLTADTRLIVRLGSVAALIYPGCVAGWVSSSGRLVWP